MSNKTCDCILTGSGVPCSSDLERNDNLNYLDTTTGNIYAVKKYDGDKKCWHAVTSIYSYSSINVLTGSSVPINSNGILPGTYYINVTNGYIYLLTNLNAWLNIGAIGVGLPIVVDNKLHLESCAKFSTGTYFLDTSTGNYYIRACDRWVLVQNIKNFNSTLLIRYRPPTDNDITSTTDVQYYLNITNCNLFLLVGVSWIFIGNISSSCNNRVE